MKPSIRQATWIDAEGIAHVRGEVMRELGSDDAEVPLEQIASVIADPGPVAIWVARVDERVVGYARAEALGPGRERMIALTEIAVASHARRHGIGSKLLHLAVGAMPALATVASSDSEAARAGRAFLEHNEFVPTTAEAGDDGHENLTFETLIR